MSEIENNTVENEEDLDEAFEEEMDDATVITVPIDDTLSNSGEAADAAAVGAALALKANVEDVKNIKVNEEAADNQGQILIDGTGIPMSSTDNTTLKAAIEAEQGKTGADIPLNSEEEAPTIEEAIAAADKTADSIQMSASDETTVAARIIDLETGAAGCVKKVNNTSADANGNVQLNKVPLADNLDSSVKQQSNGEYIIRTTGGEASISDGPASLMRVLGNSVQTGFVPESLEFSVNSDTCEASVTDMDTFREAMVESGTLTLSYTTEWSEDPTDYGITVTGTPENGDSIVAVWEQEERGTITNADPTGFIATGWNLYNQTAGYAMVVKYSDSYGYAISGSYTKIEFSETESGVLTDITPASGIMFQVPADGYVWVTGGGSDTAIWATWSDWTTGYKGDFAPYSKQTINLSAVMTACFPDGLCSVGNVRDYIDIAGGNAYKWVELMEYDAENLATAESSGRPYIYDEDYIYLVQASETVTALTGALAVSGNYTANGHGLEMFEGTSEPVGSLTSYGLDLKNRLERDVVVKSTDIADNLETNDSQKVLSAKQGKILNDRCQDMFKTVTYTYKYTAAANSNVIITKTNLGMTTPSGYKILALRGAYTGSKYVSLCCADPTSNNAMYVYNATNSQRPDITAKMIVTYVKTGMGI